LPVSQTLWTLRGPRRFEAELAGDVPPADSLAQELVRLRAITDLIERAVDHPAYGPEETARWYRDSARRWLASQNRVKRLVAATEGTRMAQTVRGELEAIQQRQAAWSECFDAGEVAAAPAGETPPEDPVSLWQRSVDRSQPPIRCMVEQVSDASHASVDQAPQAITLLCRPSRQDWLWGRFLGAGGIVLGTVVLWFGTRRAGPSRVLKQNAPWVGVAIGLGWWLVLRPSVLGLVLGAASLFVWWRKRIAPIGKSGGLC
jgi:hypothetical protein